MILVDISFKTQSECVRMWIYTGQLKDWRNGSVENVVVDLSFVGLTTCQESLNLLSVKIHPVRLFVI